MRWGNVRSFRKDIRVRACVNDAPFLGGGRVWPEGKARAAGEKQGSGGGASSRRLLSGFPVALQASTKPSLHCLVQLSSSQWASRRTMHNGSRKEQHQEAKHTSGSKRRPCPLFFLDSFFPTPRTTTTTPTCTTAKRRVEFRKRLTSALNSGLLHKLPF